MPKSSNQINIALTPDQEKQLDAILKKQPHEMKRQALAKSIFRQALAKEAARHAR